MSSKILELKRWEQISYRPEPGNPDGPVVQMEMRRLRRHEKQALRKVVIQVLSEIERGHADGLAASEKATILANCYEIVPKDELRQTVVDNVRSVSGFRVDGTDITTSSGLFEEADDDMLFFVLMTLNNLAGLSRVETFLSGSRSTSSAETASRPESPASDATPTASVAGPTPSDATVSEEIESTVSA
jgi:hypothetical protein